MRLLVLGGTKFLGRAVVEEALSRGDEVTLFNRGTTNAELFPGVEKLRGDRDGDLSALEGREWDAVVDPSAYVPHVLKRSAEVLRDAVGHYTFVSSVSVYAGYEEPVHEESPLEELGDGSPTELAGDYSNYGALKALCEDAVEEILPGRVLHVRAGLIVGPHDPTGRFTYWPHRVARGGEVLVPGPPERLVQFIDVRDLAAWIRDVAERRVTGRFNAISRPFPQRELLDAAARVTGSGATFTYVDEGWLKEQGVGEWMELPLWVAPAGEMRSFMQASTSAAHEQGLTERPLEDTVAATLAEAELVDGVGLLPGREAELLAAWHDRGST